jgi:hypothetical protein
MELPFNGMVMEWMLEGLAWGIQITMVIGGLSSNVLLACEILIHMLRGSGLVDQEPVFPSRYVAVDFMSLEIIVEDIAGV